MIESTAMQPLINEQSLTQLVVSLSNYTEEGKSISPEMYVSSNRELMLSLLPGSTCFQIGSCEPSNNSLTIALKHCAPLANGGWCIWVSENNQKIEYGVFRDTTNPLAVPLSDTLLNIGSEVLKVIKIHQTAPSCIEIRNHKNDSHNIFLSNKRESDESPGLYVADLANAICSKVNIKFRESTHTLLSRVLNDGLLESHGALVAVTNRDTPPKILSDGLFLSPPLNFAKLVEQARHGEEEHRRQLTSTSKLLEGMFGCDGIILFNRKATLLGYNCFIKSSQKTGPVSGGARKRAFQAMQHKIGKGLFAAFIQSQDGWSNFEKNNDD